MREATFDTGALVRLQRERRKLKDVLQMAAEEEIALTTSAAALVEFLGGSPRSLRARADWIASRFEVAAITEVVARRAATLVRAARDTFPSASPGPIDALVVAEAERQGSVVVISGDRKDFEALAASGRPRVIDLEALIAGG